MQEMQEVFEAEDVVAFRDALTKKNIICVTGTVGDYVILFIGKSEEELVIVATHQWRVNSEKAGAQHTTAAAGRKPQQ